MACHTWSQVRCKLLCVPAVAGCVTELIAVVCDFPVPGEDRIYFHVSSKKHSEHTNSERFRGHVLAAFATIHALFKAHAADTSSAGGQ